MTSAMDNNDAELPHAYEDTSGRGIGFDETRGTSFPHSRSHQLKWKMKDMNHDSGRHSMLEDGEEEEIESEYVSQEEEKSEANNYDEAALDSQVAVQMENISEDANVQDRGNGTFPVNKQVEYEEQMQKAAALANEMTALKNSIENARVRTSQQGCIPKAVSSADHFLITLPFALFCFLFYRFRTPSSSTASSRLEPFLTTSRPEIYCGSNLFVRNHADACQVCSSTNKK